MKFDNGITLVAFADANAKLDALMEALVFMERHFDAVANPSEKLRLEGQIGHIKEIRDQLEK